MMPNLYLIGFVLTGSLLIGASIGWNVKTVLVDAKEVKEVRLEREMLAKSKKDNDKLVREVIEARARTNTIYKIKEKEVPVYVTKIQKVDSDCNLTNGTVSLLNSTAKELPQATSRIIADVRQSSHFTEGQLVMYTLRLLKRIHRDKDLHNPLVQWHLDNNNVLQMQ